MAEPAKPAKGKGKGKKILGMPRGVVIAGGLGLAAGVLFIWYRNRKAAAAATSTAGGACQDANGNPGTLDANGNCISSGSSAGTDQSGTLSALQTELQDLQAQVAADAAGDTGSGGSGGSGGGGGGGTGKVAKYHAPTGLRVTGKTRTSAHLQWNAVTAPSKPAGYIVRIDHGTAEVQHQTVTGTMAEVTGLKHSTTYQARVRADGSTDSSPPATVMFTTNGLKEIVNPGGPMKPATGAAA